MLTGFLHKKIKSVNNLSFCNVVQEISSSSDLLYLAAVIDRNSLNLKPMLGVDRKLLLVATNDDR
jgi:hypothetical protein